MPGTSTPVSGSSAVGVAAERLITLLLKDDDQTRLTTATWDLLDAALTTSAQRRKARKRGSHALCELFEDLTVAIDEILKAPGILVDALVDAIFDQLTPQWLPRAVAKAVLKKLFDALLTADPGVVALHALAVKTSYLAMVSCPAIDQHGSLDQTCAPRALQATLSATPD